MQQTASALSPIWRPNSREELAHRALGATVWYYTAGECNRRRTGRVTFGDVKMLHLLVENDEGKELVPLLNCRVVSRHTCSLEVSFIRLNVWKFGEGWRGYGIS